MQECCLAAGFRLARMWGSTTQNTPALRRHLPHPIDSLASNQTARGPGPLPDSACAYAIHENSTQPTHGDHLHYIPASMPHMPTPLGRPHYHPCFRRFSTTLAHHHNNHPRCGADRPTTPKATDPTSLLPTIQTNSGVEPPTTDPPRTPRPATPGPLAGVLGLPVQQLRRKPPH